VDGGRSDRGGGGGVWAGRLGDRARLDVLGHEVGDTRLMGVAPMPVWMRSVL
jgi:hypothetical protein